MKAEIWHAINPTWRDDQPLDFPQGFSHVADLEVAGQGIEALDDAYRDSNNIDRSWTRNPSVIILFPPHEKGARSTSVGDVITLGGVPFLCSRNGWRNLTKSDGDGGSAPKPAPLSPVPTAPQLANA